MACVPSGCRTVLEFGPGDGVVTRALLDRLPADGRLLAIETNAEFVETLSGIHDARLEVVHGSASDTADYASRSGFAGFDLAVSGIPFSMLSPGTRRSVVSLVGCLLKPGGVFIVYQPSPLMVKYLKREFAVSTQLALGNVPPYFVMRAVKPAYDRGN